MAPIAFDMLIVARSRANAIGVRMMNNEKLATFLLKSLWIDDTIRPQMATHLDIEQQMKRAIAAASVSRYALAKQSAVSEGVISNFMSGRRTITLETAAKLAVALGLELKPIRKMRKTETMEHGKSHQ